jgi:hypothetical protein
MTSANADGKAMIALARPPSIDYLRCCSRLLASRPFSSSKQNGRRGAMHRSTPLAYLMEQCQSLKAYLPEQQT